MIATVPEARQARRLKLIALIRAATAELEQLERAAHRVTELAGSIRTALPVGEDPTDDGPILNVPDSIVRAWARDTGLDVAQGGRLRQSIRVAFAEAHPNGWTPPPVVPVQRRYRHAPGIPNDVVRAWARANGVPVNPRGSVWDTTRAAYQAAHPDTLPVTP